MGVSEEQARHVVAVAYRCAASVRGRGRHWDMDVEDVAQDAAIRVLRDYDQERGSVEAFVAAVVSRVASDHKRCAARRKARLEALEAEWGDAVAWQPDLAELEAEQVDAELARAVCGVVRYGDVLRRVFLEGVPQLQIAHETGRNPGRVSRWKQMALRDAREVLELHREAA